MARRTNLPAVLAVPLLADRLAVELEVAAQAVPGDTPTDRDRRAFLASASVQVAEFGTDAVRPAAGDGGLAQLRPAADPDLETRTG